MMKKVILSVDIHDDKDKQKAMKKVSGLTGVESISVNLKEQKLTLIGDFDPVIVVNKLRKVYHTKVVSVGPEKEEKKGEKKDGDQKKPAEGDKKDKKDEITALLDAYKNYHPFVTAHCFQVAIPADEDPNSCVIL